MVDVATLSINVNTTDLKDGEAALNKFAKAGKKTEAAAAKVVTSTSRMQAVMRGPGLRNFAQQMNQVGQQTAATGNFMQSLTIQLPDLLLGFGTLGIALGAVAPLIIGLGSSLLGAGVEAKSLEEQLDELADSVAFLDTLTERASQAGAADLAESYGVLTQAVRELVDAQRELALREAVDDLNAASEALQFTAGFFDTGLLGAIRGTTTEFARIRSELELTAPAAVQFGEALDQLSDASGPRAQADAYARMRDIIVATAGGIDNLSAAQLEYVNNLAKAEDAARRMAVATGEAKTEAFALGQALASIPGVAESAAGALGGLAGPLQTAANAAWDLYDGILAAQGLETTRGGMSDEQYQQFLGYQAYGQSRAAAPDTPVTRSTRGRGGGGGGGGGRGAVADLFLSDLQSLQDELMTEQETLDEWYFENLAILEDRRAAEILGEEGHREALIRLEQEYQDRLSGIQGDGHSDRLAGTADFFGSMASVFEAGGGKMARAAKLFGGIEATINAYRAANQALADPTVPFWGKAAAYAATLATGLQAVSAIKGSGGGGGSSGFSRGPSAAAAPQAPARVLLEGIDANSIFTGQQLQDLADALHEEFGDRGINLSVLA